MICTWMYYFNILKNFALVFSLFMLTRFVFVIYNINFFQNIGQNDFWLLLIGSLTFDLSGILYVNILYIFFVFSPLPNKWRNSKFFTLAAKWIFVIFNSLAIIVNLIDTVYFPFSQRRTTWSIFNEFSHNDNLGEIFRIAMVQNWYLVLIAIGMIFILYYFYSNSNNTLKKTCKGLNYWLITSIVFPLVIFGTVIGIRGGVGRYVRPITLSNANQYVNQPIDASIVLNTPFSLIRTIENNSLPTFSYFKNQIDAEKIHPVVHQPINHGKMKKMNVVVLIIESFGREYVGSLNKETIGQNYEGYTPFLDSLIQKSLTFESSFANGRKSIDALPSVLSSIPRVGEPYFVGDYGNNKVLSLAGDLKKKGYYTAFFHGAPNGSMGFWAFTKSSGFQDYFGMTEYGNQKDFDGTWAIWDDPFFQFYANKMNGFKEPFMTAIFSASSHHPYVVPEEYNGKLKEGSLPIHKCVRYTDIALRHFFEKASKMPWFNNTLFVITADHTNESDQPSYQNEIGRFSVPIIFYCPGVIAPEYSKEIAQQIDIKPSVLGFLNYDLPYVAFGRDIFHTKDSLAFAFDDDNGQYLYYSGDYQLQFDGKKANGLFNFKTDRMQKSNLLGTKDSLEKRMELQVKAILQTYQQRMKENNLTVK